MREDKALPPGRNGSRRHVRVPYVGDRPQVRYLGVSTMPDSRTHHPTAIVTGKVVGECLRYDGPIAARELRQKAVGRSACHVFQTRRRPIKLVERCECGVELCLVEQLKSADQVAVKCEKADLAPLGIEAFL